MQCVVYSTVILQRVSIGYFKSNTKILFILCDDLVVWDRKRRKLSYIQNETFMVVRAALVCGVVPPD